MTEYIEIEGGTRLNGTITASGAKNAALPILIATLLSGERCVLENVPNLTDTNLVIHLLEQFGAEVEFSNGRVTTQARQLAATEASYSLVKALRASFWVLAPVLARGRAARVALPGGDIIGARPVDIHLEGLAQMGADITVKHGVVYATAPNGLKPVNFDLRYPSVGATHQLIMAASLTPGLTVLKGAAREPEVVALANYLNSMGADVQGAGSSVVEIRGKEELGAASARLIGDRIEAGTYLLAAAITGGKIRVNGIDPLYFGKFLDILSNMGVKVTSGDNFVKVDAAEPLKAVHVVTGPFPEFASDLQAPLMAALTRAAGTSTMEETVYEGRFGHASELSRMGAHIKIHERMVTVEGVEKLTGAPVDGHDIRAAASLVISALAAEGLSQIHEPHHLRRGYENLEEKLTALGAKIWCRVSDPEDFMFTGC